MARERPTPRKSQELAPDLDLKLSPSTQELSDLDLKPKTQELPDLDLKVEENPPVDPDLKIEPRIEEPPSSFDLNQVGGLESQKVEGNGHADFDLPPDLTTRVEQPPKVEVTSPEAAPQETPSNPEPQPESPKTFVEVLGLQREAFSARRDMIAFRKGKKVEDLSEEDQAKYKQLREVSQQKRQAWLAEIGKLPEEEQGELKELTKLKEVEAKFREVSPHAIRVRALLRALEEHKIELAAVDQQLGQIKEKHEFAGYEYDKGTARSVTALDIEGERKEISARRRAVLARIKDIENQLTEDEEETVPAGKPEEVKDLASESIIKSQEESSPAAEVPLTHPEAPVAENLEVPQIPKAKPEYASFAMMPEGPWVYDRDQADARARAREELLSASIELDRRIEEKRAEVSTIPAWKVFALSRARTELNDLADEKNKVERELRKDRPGFGTRFAEKVKNAYRKFKAAFAGSKLAGEEGFIIPMGSKPMGSYVGRGETEPIPEPVEPAPQPPTPEPEPEPIIPRPDPAPPPAPEARPQPAVENPPAVERRPSRGTWGGWLKERMKGLFTAGALEFIHANRFRTGTKNTAKDLNKAAEGIQKEQNLSLEDALAEAELIQAIVQRGTKEWTTDVSKAKIEKASQEITARKIARNNEHVDRTIVATITSLEERLKKYKGVSGQNVLTEEAKDKIASEIKTRMNQVRSNQLETDVKEVTTMLRQNLEPKWWHRNVYGALELALAATAVYFTSQAIASKYAAAKAGGVTSQEAAKVALKDTVWAEAKRQLIENGVTNPTNSQIQQVATQFCRDSGVKVVTQGGEILWQQTSGGIVKDIALQKGFMIDISGGLETIAKIKAAGL